MNTKCSWFYGRKGRDFEALEVLASARATAEAIVVSNRGRSLHFQENDLVSLVKTQAGVKLLNSQPDPYFGPQFPHRIHEDDYERHGPIALLWNQLGMTKIGIDEKGAIAPPDALNLDYFWYDPDDLLAFDPASWRWQPRFRIGVRIHGLGVTEAIIVRAALFETVRDVIAKAKKEAKVASRKTQHFYSCGVQLSEQSTLSECGIKAHDRLVWDVVL